MSASSASINKLPNLDTQSEDNLTLLFGISVLTTLSVFISCRVSCIVFFTSKKRSRPANTLVAHLSFVVVSFTFVVFAVLLGKYHIIDLAKPGLCNIFFFFIHVIYSVFLLNIGAIIWVRMRSNAADLRRKTAYRAMCLMWPIALAINLPVLFMVKSITSPDDNLNGCKPDLLFGSTGVTIGYESFRVLLFHVAVCIYVIRASLLWFIASIILKASMKYIRLLKGKMMTKRITKIQFMHLHTIVLIFGWFPNGVVLFLFQISAPLDWTTDFMKYFAITMVFSCIVFIICPLSYVFMLEDMSLAKFCVPCLPTNTSSLPVVIYSNRQNDPKAFGWRVDPIVNPELSLPPKTTSVTWSKKTGVRILENVEMRMLTTEGLTVPSSSPSHSVPQVFSSRSSSYSQACSIPALLTPSTSAKPKTFAVRVQVHAEPNIIDGENEMELSECNTITMI